MNVERDACGGGGCFLSHKEKAGGRGEHPLGGGGGHSGAHCLAFLPFLPLHPPLSLFKPF